MMAADDDDEIEELDRRKSTSIYHPTQKSGKSSSFGLIIWLSIVFWVIELITDARKTLLGGK